MGTHEKIIRQRSYVESLEQMGSGRVSSKILREARHDLEMLELDRENDAADARRRADLAWKKEIGRIREEGSPNEKEELESELRVIRSVNKAWEELASMVEDRW